MCSLSASHPLTTFHPKRSTIKWLGGVPYLPELGHSFMFPKNHYYTIYLNTVTLSKQVFLWKFLSNGKLFPTCSLLKHSHRPQEIYLACQLLPTDKFNQHQAEHFPYKINHQYFIKSFKIFNSGPFVIFPNVRINNIIQVFLNEILDLFCLSDVVTLLGTRK